MSMPGVIFGVSGNLRPSSLRCGPKRITILKIYLLKNLYQLLGDKYSLIFNRLSCLISKAHKAKFCATLFVNIVLL